MDNIINKFTRKIKNAIQTIESTCVNISKNVNTDNNININGFNVVAYFRNGSAYKVVPKPSGSYYDNRDILYNADAIVSDGILYDLGNTESIASIPVPNFGLPPDNNISESLGATGSLDYVLRMKSGQYYNQDKRELCSACLWKATELMLANSSFCWNETDFMRLVYWHYELGMPDEAKRAAEFLAQNESYIKSLAPFDSCAAEIKNTTFENAKKYNYDLVAFHDYGTGCCEECAKYRGRVYSISGCSPDFPPLPEYVKVHGNFHSGCRCAMSLYMGGTIYYKGERVDALIASNRPFVDDRTPEEKEAYDKYVKELEDKIAAAQRRLENSILHGKNRDEFLYFTENYPDIAPKTIDGYIKGKRAMSKKFKQLAALAEADGITIDYSAI